jgi:predicted nucleic acid-binding protein
VGTSFRRAGWRGYASTNADVSMIYLDSSAIVKLAIDEPESAALRRALRGRTELVSSALARTEVTRTLLPEGQAIVNRGEAVLERIELARVNDRVLRLAGQLTPYGLRSLDAIHLATAKLLERVKLVVTYDERMAEAARAMKWKVSAPR